jgi:hypothetical protein
MNTEGKETEDVIYSDEEFRKIHECERKFRKKG